MSDVDIESQTPNQDSERLSARSPVNAEDQRCKLSLEFMASSRLPQFRRFLPRLSGINTLLENRERRGTGELERLYFRTHFGTRCL